LPHRRTGGMQTRCDITGVCATKLVVAPLHFEGGVSHRRFAAGVVCGQDAMRRGGCDKTSGGATTFRRGVSHRRFAAGGVYADKMRCDGCLQQICDATRCRVGMLTRCHATGCDVTGIRYDCRGGRT
jgi:hypothetical protein